MKTLWRISNHGDLAGLGGEKGDGRWHTAARGKRIVYLSEHPALALIESLANLRGNPFVFPDRFQLLKVNVPDDTHIEAWGANLLTDEWRDRLEETRAAGDQWLKEGRSALLAVPSAASPESTNFLLHPLQAEARNIEVEWRRLVKYDQRLFHLIGRTHQNPG